MKKQLFLQPLLLLTACGLAAAQPDSAATPSHAVPVKANTAKIAASYGKIPLQFEANQGQSSKLVKFLSRGNGYSLFLTPSEAVLALSTPAKTRSPKLSPSRKPGHGKISRAAKVHSDTVRMTLHGANPNSHLAGENALPGKVNYFIGSDPKKWRTNVATYGKVRYQSVYPGVDLVYYGNQHQLEYDFVVAPGADPKAICLNFTGARRMKVNNRGELVLGLSGGDIRWQLPVVYQEVGGARKPVSGGYVLKGKGQVGFRVAQYDRHKPLVIDPTLVYSTYLGGSGDDRGDGIKVDNSGNVYITGITHSTDFPLQNPLQATNKSMGDVFITKLNAAGTALVYSTYLGGSASEYHPKHRDR